MPLWREAFKHASAVRFPVFRLFEARNHRCWGANAVITIITVGIGLALFGHTVGQVILVLTFR
ncbi:MAG: hypothetical protein JOZ19_14250 [Rubrobacter sp.]|nr:hypothetical protein [Rubrobacter sp.]